MVCVADVFPTKRALHQSDEEERQEAEHNAHQHDLTRRYFFSGPFHEDEIASPDHAEQGKSKICGFLHVMGHHGPAAHCCAAGLQVVSSAWLNYFSARVRT